MPGPGPAPKQPPPKKPTAEQEIETLTRAKAEWEAAYHGARSEIETMRVGLTIAENDLAKALAKNADLASRVGKLELALQVNRGAATTHKEMVEKMVGSAREMIEQAQAVIKEQTATMASQREQIGKLLDMNKQLIEMAPRRETRSTLGNPVLGEE
jgi:chromosome segregation ATPase